MYGLRYFLKYKSACQKKQDIPTRQMFRRSNHINNLKIVRLSMRRYDIVNFLMSVRIIGK